MTRVIVTGGSSGIGAAVVRALADRGVDTLAIARRPEPLQKLCEYAPDYIQMLAVDFCTPQTITLHASHIVHAAGIGAPFGAITSLTHDDLSRFFGTHVLVLHNLLRAVNPDILERVLVIDSESAYQPRNGWSGYSVSKAALAMYARCLQTELTDSVLVRLLKPGAVDTPLLRKAMNTPSDEFPDAGQFKALEKTSGLSDAQAIGAAFTDLLLNTDEAGFMNHTLEEVLGK